MHFEKTKNQILNQLGLLFWELVSENNNPLYWWSKNKKIKTQTKKKTGSHRTIGGILTWWAVSSLERSCGPKAHCTPTALLPLLLAAAYGRLHQLLYPMTRRNCHQRSKKNKKKNKKLQNMILVRIQQYPCWHLSALPPSWRHTLVHLRCSFPPSSWSQ